MACCTVPPETDRDQIGGTAPNQPAIEPGRSVSFDLPFQLEGPKAREVELPISSGIMGGGPALKILWETPMVGIDPLDDPARRNASSRRTWASMKPSWSPPGTRPSNRGLLQMAARPIDAILRHTGNGAVEGRRPTSADPISTMLPMLMSSTQPDRCRETWWVRPSTPSMMRVKFSPSSSERCLSMTRPTIGVEGAPS